MTKYSREWWAWIVNNGALGMMGGNIRRNEECIKAFADGKTILHLGDEGFHEARWGFDGPPEEYSIKPEEPEKVKILDVPVLSRTREEWAEVLEATLIGQFPERLARNITTIKAFAEGKTVLISGKIADTTMVFGNPPSDYSIQEDPLAPAWVRPLELRIEKLEKEILESIDD